MKKILVISPSGEVYDHDCVRWYANRSFAVAAGSLPQYRRRLCLTTARSSCCDYTQLDGMNIRDPSDADIDRYNSEFDFAFLRGSNYLHHDHGLGERAVGARQLRIPIIAFGIGAQAPAKGRCI